MAAETRHIFPIEEEWLAQILSRRGSAACCFGPLGSVTARGPVGPKRRVNAVLVECVRRGRNRAALVFPRARLTGRSLNPEVRAREAVNAG